MTVKPGLPRPRTDRAVLREEPTVLVFETMGTVASVAVPVGLGRATRIGLLAEFDRIETRFTMHDLGSEAMRVSRSEMALDDASAEYREVLAQARDWSLETGAAFTPYPPAGGIDLTGIVKALAIEAGGLILDDATPHWCLNVGGDILVRGHPSPEQPWVAGILNPAERTRLVASFSLTPPLRAMATSGYSERGDHIWRPVFADAAAVRYDQVTVAAADIVAADVLATAILAGGPATLDAILARHRVEVLAISADGSIRATPGFTVPSAPRSADTPVARTNSRFTSRTLPAWASKTRG